ncbi:MAG: DUF5672 family protein [bacterium]|nr:DUF5672 family protein [bacterium]
MKRVCIVIPIYKSELSVEEKYSIKNTIRHLGQYDIWFIMPKKMDLRSFQEFNKIRIKKFEDTYFQSVDMYSKLLLNPHFYEKFIEYDYMLIVQPDAYIFGDGKQLEYFMNMKIDYWGAPWYKPWEVRRIEPKQSFEQLQKSDILMDLFCGRRKKCDVGNGGLSLRRVDMTIKLLKHKLVYLKWWEKHEDLFFAYHGTHNHIGYRVASFAQAREFSMEERMREEIRKGFIPFGVHAWKKWYPQMQNEIEIAEN